MSFNKKNKEKEKKREKKSVIARLLSLFPYLSHSTENWIFLKLHVADTTAQYWEKRDINPNVFILEFGCDTLMR